MPPFSRHSWIYIADRRILFPAAAAPFHRSSAEPTQNDFPPRVPRLARAGPVSVGRGRAFTGKRRGAHDVAINNLGFAWLGRVFGFPCR